MFYGWRVVAVTFVTHFVSVGFIFYSYGAFFKALAAEFGGSRLSVSVGLSIMQLVTGLFAPFLGRMLDRGSIRHIMTLGALLMGCGFVLCARIAELWQFYAVLGTLLAVGAAMLGGLAGSTLVANWFIARRGTALGVATMGISLSGLIMAPLATRLIATYGWRLTFVLYGVVVLVGVLPLAWLAIVNRPEDLDLLPDGSPDPARVAPRDALPEPVLPLAPGDQIIDHPARLEWSTLGALRDGNFWAIVVAAALNFCAMGAVLVHIIPHATDIGFSPDRAALVLSCMAGAGVIGKLLFGWLADRASVRLGFSLSSLLQAFGVFLLLDARGLGALLLSGAIFGLGMGGLVPLWGALVGAAFGRFAFGRVMGLMSPCMLPIQMLGVPFAGYVYDLRGSYDLALWIFIGLYAASLLTILRLRLPDVLPESSASTGGQTAVYREDRAGDVRPGA
ncbi:MAG: MFS transporter [Myxococcota bacterium]